MEIRPIAFFKSPVEGKFGVPRQSGIAPGLSGEVRLVAPYDNPDALRGLTGFDYIWLIWEFSLNGPSANLTVRPPRLGGNERVGVFASRSPFRPNPLGLSCVKVASIEADKGIIHVLGADLADGTPVYDIKPYVAYADCHPDARSGFVDGNGWSPLEVEVPDSLASLLAEDELAALRQLLSCDPRPQYLDNPEREYGLTFAGRNVRFRVCDGVASVTEITGAELDNS
ncbi:MAG: tRNA (N6-threonylcarbamoyladenosine(37)-N6)-methyltransferase TrmO [Bacteroidales bacterium]|nr:tRNA (N6-threonylcarbamoyladenosine(37)-N6)-methyltransferase TrmO [Bacteroidales bacterium]